MSFNSIQQILAAIEKQPSWRRQQQYCHLLQCWEKVVSTKIAQVSHPLYIASKVLFVATSSAVWAQTLSFERYQLLKKLNTLLPENLSDIRFSPTLQAIKNHSQSRLENHLSKVERNLPLPLCPSCNAPTTPGELQRWRLCCHCAAKQWQDN